MSDTRTRRRKLTLWCAPWALLLTTWLVYQMAVAQFGPQLGYFLGFLFYWFGWCLGLSWWAIGWSGIVEVLRDVEHRFTSRRWLGLLLLAFPLVMAYGYEFPRALEHATVPVVLASAAISIVNGLAEELLWRGVYPKIFPDSVGWGYLYPTLGFAVWHFAPQSVYPNARPGGAWSLVLAAGIVGLMWGWVAWRSGSIRWTSISHILFDFSGLGGRLYF